MRRILLATLLSFSVLAATCPVRADEKEAKTIIDKAIAAMGGAAKLAQVQACAMTGKGTVIIEAAEIPFTFETITQGIEKYRTSYQGEFDGNKFTGATVVDGNKGWRKRDDQVTKLDAKPLASEKRNAYLDFAPIFLLPLQEKRFKVDSAADQKVGDKNAAVVRVVEPNGKDFTIFFDKESGLPLKLSAIVANDDGEEAPQETIFEDYQEIAGIKFATNSRTTRDGKPYIVIEAMTLKPLATVEPDAFTEPK